MYFQMQAPSAEHGREREHEGGKGAPQEGAREMWGWEGEGVVLTWEMQEGPGGPGSGSAECQTGMCICHSHWPGPN